MIKPLAPESILNSLNPEQQVAASHIDGPMLILAGPGSGKTRVITHRIAHMLAHGIPGENIAALTFTNKAADEMNKRIAKLAPGSRVWTGTFHRFCSRLLRRHASMTPLKENFTIYDSGDSKKVIKQAIENVNVDIRHFTADRIANEVSNVKNHGVSVDRFQPRPGNVLDAIVAKVYPEYQKLLQLANGVDFDDLLLYAVELLRHNPELRQSLDEHFQYMMVDEYQDTNLAQYQLIRLLNHSHQNLAVTGDPDQSIYGWRGANINNILHFERDYESVQIVRLEQNYRSTQCILRAADQLIQNNTRRKQKTLRTDNDEGAEVRLVTYPNPEDEATDIVDTIALSISRGESNARDYTILYRANYLSRAFEHAFRLAGIPYQIVNGHEFYQRKEIKDVMAYLHLVNNPADNVAFERIVNVPSRKIGKVTLGRLRRFAIDHGTAMLEAARCVDEVDSIAKATATRIKQFVSMMDRIASVPPDSVRQLISTVLNETEYRNWLTLDGSEEGYERAGNIDELMVAAEEFDRDHPEDGGLEAYLEQASLVADTDVFDGESDYVTLMTMHAAKGLEFPHVYIVGLEDGILPHERSASDDDQVEEERRLLFVGITRAEQTLQLSRCQTRFRRGSYWPCIASRFLMELPRHEMAVFEPAKRSFGQEDLDDLIDDLSSWDELPSIDIHADVDESDPRDTGPTDDRVSESPVTSPMPSPRPAASKRRKTDPTKRRQDGPSEASAPAIANLMTAADLEAGNENDLGPRLDADQVQSGMVVGHANYGVGIVREITGEGKKRIAKVRFDEDEEERTLILAFANLKRISPAK